MQRSAPDHQAGRSARSGGDRGRLRRRHLPSSGNVFADLGLPQPEERLAKALLARELGRLIRARGLTQRATALILGIDQPKVSHVLHGRLAGFSTQRLLSFLTSLGQDVDILVRPAPRPPRRGRLRVLAA